jgi:hypothetical protein
MKIAFFSLMFLSGIMAQGQIQILIGPPPPPPVEVIVASPGPDYFWVEGYWYPVRGRYIWHPGYWTLPPYRGARWIIPRYEQRYYYRGYWGGPRGIIVHEHRWDRARIRDFNRSPRPRR